MANRDFEVQMMMANIGWRRFAAAGRPIGHITQSVVVVARRSTDCRRRFREFRALVKW